MHNVNLIKGPKDKEIKRYITVGERREKTTTNE